MPTHTDATYQHQPPSSALPTCITSLPCTNSSSHLSCTIPWVQLMSGCSLGFLVATPISPLLVCYILRLGSLFVGFFFFGFSNLGSRRFFFGSLIWIFGCWWFFFWVVWWLVAILVAVFEWLVLFWWLCFLLMWSFGLWWFV